MEQEDIERGGGRGYDIKRGGGRKGYDIEIDQEQEEMMMRRKSNVIRFEDDHQHQQNSTSTNAKKTKGKLHKKKPEKKTPRRGVGIAKLEETIKQKNSQLPAAADRLVYHGYPATTSNNQSQPQIQFHRHPLLHHQQQKKTSTVSSPSLVHGANGGHLNLNHVPKDAGGYDEQVMNCGGYDQFINYGSASTNVNNNGGHDHQLMIKSNAQQPAYVNLLHPSKQQQHGNSTTYNPSPAGSVVVCDQHGNHDGFYSPKFAELSSTQKQQHYSLSPQQHSHDHNPLNYQKNLNNGEDIGGFTPYSKTNIKAQITDSKSADFLQLDLGCKWSNNNVDTKKDSKAAAAGLLRAGYSGLCNGYDDHVELLAVHRKGKSSSNISMEYDFLSLTNGGQHQFSTKKGEYEPHYSSNYSSSSCVMEESAASSSALFRKGSTVSSSSQSNSDHHEFLDLSLKLSSYH